MKELKTIKAFYKPMQPSVKPNDPEIVYEEVLPQDSISNFVYCFWQLKTVDSLKAPFIYRVVSDGCIDIFFYRYQPELNFVMGFCRKYTEFPIGQEFDYIGIRFLPSTFPLLFGINAKFISNQSPELKHTLPWLSEWIATNIKPEHTFPKIISILSQKLEEHMSAAQLELDQRFFKALHLIFKRKGFLDTETDLQTGLSPRQLRRIFNYYIGTTPKAFSNVVRFQYILNAKPSIQSLKKNKLYYDVGFFDQAHFIKQFKTFYGVTPSEAFR